MLNIFRESAKTFLIRVLIWLVALTFVGTAFLVWGQQGAVRGDIVAVVGKGEYITNASLERRTRQIEATLRQQLGDQVDYNVLQSLDPANMAMNALIDSALQIRAAEKAGLAVMDEEVRDTITKMTEFQQGGAFSKQRYLEILHSNQLTPKMFESDLKRDLLVFKLRSLVERVVRVTDAEIVDRYITNNQKVIAEYVDIDSTPLADKVEMDQGKLEEWFESRKSDFQIEERRTFRILSANPDQMANAIEVGEEDLKEYYDTHADRFATEESVHARHILIQVAMDAAHEDVQTAKKKIDDAYKRVRDGEDFGQVAMEVSEGPSAQNSGDLGNFSKGQMVPEFENIAFALEDGGVSEPFRTQFGWHIVQTLAHTKAGAKSFEEAKPQVLDLAKKDKAYALASEIMNNLSKSLTADNFSTGVEAHEGITLDEYSVEKNQPIPQIAESKLVSDLVFDLEKSTVSEPLELYNRFIITIVDDIEPPETPALEDVKKRAESRYRAEQARELAQEIADRIESAVKNEGKTLAAAAKENGYTSVVTAPFSRAIMMERGTQNLPQGLVSHALGSSVGDVATADSVTGVMVYTVISQEPVDVEVMRKEFPKLRQEIQQAKRGRVYAEYVAALRKQAEENGEIKIRIKLGKTETNESS